jgi:hypothetical protein
MSGMNTSALAATWHGHVATTRDALILFEACLNGMLHHVPRRPHDRERGNLIRSGSVFIYEENASGIKRWTDGVPWSPSRILGNFLLYRELEKPFPPGEKKRATKRDKRATRPGEPYPRASSDSSPSTPRTPIMGSSSKPEGSGVEDRALIGSLVDSYPFKEHGLVKKTMSVVVHGVHHHLVSYYALSDVNNGVLVAPSKYPPFANVTPRQELISGQSFKASLDEAEEPPQAESTTPGPAYGYHPSGYDISRSSMMMGTPGQHNPAMMYPQYGGQAPITQNTPHSYIQGSYYPGQSQPMQGQPRQEDYGGYSHGYHSAQSGPSSSNGSLVAERANSATQQHHLGYRSESYGPAHLTQNASSGTTESGDSGQDQKPGAGRSWVQPPTVVYSPTSSHESPSYQNVGNYQQAMNQPGESRGGQSEGWQASEAQKWQILQQSAQARHPGYPQLNEQGGGQQR